jgi:uncharacterized protein involved in exopolysaccharide biosynthesis
VTVISVAITMLVTFFTAPSYQSTATLVVQPLTIDQPLAFSSTSEVIARNVGELVKSPAVQQRAAKALGKAKLNGTFEYRVLESSALIQIINVASSPKEAADEANAVADAYMASSTEAMNSSAGKVAISLSNQLTQLRSQVKQTQDALAAARSVPNGAAKVSELQDELDSLQTGYQNVLRETQLLPASQIVVSTAVIVADRAVPQPEVVSPKPLLNLVLSIAGGLLLGIAWARATYPRAKGRETGD